SRAEAKYLRSRRGRPCALTSPRMADAPQEPKQKTPKGLEIPVPRRTDVMDALRRGIQPRMASDAYRATLKVGQDEPHWLPTIVACYELAIERGEFDATEVRQRLGGEWVQLKPLV